MWVVGREIEMFSGVLEEEMFVQKTGRRRRKQMMERVMMNAREYLTYEVCADTRVDETGVSMLEHNQIHGLMRFKYVHEEDRDYFRYDVDGQISLAEWLLQIHYKEEVLSLIYSIVAVCEELPPYLLKQEHLLTELTQINVVDGKCRFAYVPVSEIKGDGLTLIQRILGRLKYPADEDYGYIFDLQNVYGRGEIRNLADLRKWLRIVQGEAEDASNVPHREKEREQALEASGYEMKKEPGFSEAKLQESKESETEEPEKASAGQEKNDAINDIFAEFGIPVSVKAGGKQKKSKPEKDKKGNIHLFGRKKEEVQPSVPVEPVQKQAAVPDSSQMVINDLNRGNKTVLMDDYGDGASPRLIRDVNRREYVLHTGESVIGSGKDADIMLTDNSAISRKHARLFVSNGEYFIEDLGSTNGTRVNGEVLIPHAPCLIRDMAHIKISNETFTFRVGR